MYSEWKPGSWRDKPAEQLPVYKNQNALKDAENTLRRQPPLVFAGEARNLKDALAGIAAGHGFLLQGGDCAESFDECTSDNVVQKLKILLQMSLVLVHGVKGPLAQGNLLLDRLLGAEVRIVSEIDHMQHLAPYLREAVDAAEAARAAELAESFEESPDRLAYTFRLRHDEEEARRLWSTF